MAGMYAPPGFGASYLFVAFSVAWPSTALVVLIAFFGGFHRAWVARIGVGLGVLAAGVVIAATYGSVKEQGAAIKWAYLVASAALSTLTVALPIWQYFSKPPRRDRSQQAPSGQT
jgi:chromate transport protein ChrA